MIDPYRLFVVVVPDRFVIEDEPIYARFFEGQVLRQGSGGPVEAARRDAVAGDGAADE